MREGAQERDHGRGIMGEGSWERGHDIRTIGGGPGLWDQVGIMRTVRPRLSARAHAPTCPYVPLRAPGLAWSPPLIEPPSHTRSSPS